MQSRLVLVIVFLLNLCPLTVQAGEAQGDLIGAAKSKEWIKLGHYVKTWFGIGDLQSQVDGPAFFLSPEGKTSPEKELIATDEAFRRPLGQGEPDEHPLCRFSSTTNFPG